MFYPLKLCLNWMKCLMKIKNNESITAVVFKSAKPGIFIAGADISEIKGIKSIDDAFEKSKQGQEIFNKIEKLPFPTISIINGACLGGGFELVLATNFQNRLRWQKSAAWFTGG